jgi:hypothetical protein
MTISRVLIVAIGTSVLSSFSLATAQESEDAYSPDVQYGIGQADEALLRGDLGDISDHQMNRRRLLYLHATHRHHSETATGAQIESERLGRERAAQAAERRRLEALRREAERLRGEITQEDTKQSQASDAANIDDEDDWTNSISRWFTGTQREPRSTTKATRDRKQIDELLRGDGLTVEVDGERLPAQQFQSLTQLEKVLEDESRQLDEDEKENRESWDELVKKAQKHHDLADKLQPALDAIKSEVRSEELRTVDDRHSHSDLFNAIADEIRSSSRSTTSSNATSLLGDLNEDRMTREEYEQFVEKRELENSNLAGIDDAMRGEAAAINRELASAERAAQVAQQNYNDLVRQQASQNQIRQAWDEQEQRRRQWQYQQQQQAYQQQLQQFGNSFGDLFGGGGGGGGSSTSRGSISRPQPSRSHSSVSRPGRSGSRKVDPKWNSPNRGPNAR